MKAKSKQIKHTNKVAALSLLLAGVLVFELSMIETAHAFASAQFAIKELCGHMTGNLGALLMTAAGVGAVVAAAFGNLKACYSFIVTGIGAFTISALLGLYFPNAAQLCDQGSSNNQKSSNRTITSSWEDTSSSSAESPESKVSQAIAVATGKSVNLTAAAPAKDGNTAEKTPEFDPSINEIADSF